MAGKLCLTIAAATAGALIGKKLKLPAAFMTGAMLAVIILNYVTGQAYCPTTVKPYVQMVAGAFIAMGITRQTVKDMKLIVRPLLAYLVCLTAWALFCGTVMHLVGGLDVVTAFLSCVPGGLTDISLISIDMGANTPQVTTLQSVRMIMAVGLFPILTRMFVKRFGKYYKETGPAAVSDEQLSAEAGENPPEQQPDDRQRGDLEKKLPGNVLLSLGIAMLGGSIGKLIGFPSATLTGAMIAGAVWNVMTGKMFIPNELRKLTQIIAGGMVGAMVTRADIQSLVTMMVPFAIIVGEYVIFDFVFAPLLARLFRFDLLTMILACTPAGASDMALIAGDMGGEISDVAVFHVVRLCVVLTAFPAVIRWLATIL